MLGASLRVLERLERRVLDTGLLAASSPIPTARAGNQRTVRCHRPTLERVGLAQGASELESSDHGRGRTLTAF
jgi:hypothetical protein